MFRCPKAWFRKLSGFDLHDNNLRHTSVATSVTLSVLPPFFPSSRTNYVPGRYSLRRFRFPVSLRLPLDKENSCRSRL
ncbi:unnamed protein product [Chondrus crispus]|uniref:Uncharacterized protein n=1 Tax=Chondrus crispus TaxID=2769 RepID=R7QQ96_CHOCR|nr:unnamed protein product [Chondrus crispus]CDF39933.1 unnamed protein product [Chondrus crispus]|eukprot:XP_005710227.1 unnamed protein product [Chondrus crispus]